MFPCFVAFIFHPRYSRDSEAHRPLEHGREIRNQPMGKARDPIWDYLNDDSSSHKDGQPVCKHCKTGVKSSKRVDIVKSHLQKCRAFKTYVDRQGLRVDFLQVDGNQPTLPVHKGLSASQQKAFESELSMGWYTSGTSFYRIENHHLINAFKTLNATVKVPDRKKLGGVLLDQAYEKVMQKLDGFLERNRMACFTSDGWTNITSQPVVNYMIVANAKELLLERSISRESHTAEWIARDFQRVIDNDPVSVVGVVTDNTQTNVNAWKILERQIPGFFGTGCVAHGLHLLVRGIFEFKEGVDSPLNYLAEFVSNCKNVVKFFHSRHMPNVNLRELQDEAQFKRLSLPGDTRWGSILKCVETVKQNRPLIITVVTEDGFTGPPASQAKEWIPHKALKEFVMTDNFNSVADKCIAILKPIDILIKQYQSPAIPLSDVYHDLFTLQNDLRSLNAFQEVEKVYLSQSVEFRWNFIYSDAQAVAYLFDPRYNGKHMTRDIKRATEKYISDYPKFDKDDKLVVQSVDQIETRKASIYDELDRLTQECVDMKDSNDPRLSNLINRRSHPRTWWAGKCDEYPELSRIAARVFTMVPSSAASERGFSAESFIHSKARNRLGDAKVAKLVFIKYNAATLEEYAPAKLPNDVMDEQLENVEDAEEFPHNNDSDLEML